MNEPVDRDNRVGIGLLEPTFISLLNPGVTVLGTEQKRRIAVIGGDGIGPEVVAETIKVLSEACGSDTLRFDLLPYSADYTLEHGYSLPEGEMERFGREYGAILLGALGDPRIPDMRHARDILLGARMQLDLYINKRPVRLLHEHLSPLK
ncbi:MAG: isocitrate/isopropylmalate family dehydrogenase, partial [Myxococcota bacterium]|nr:isocitrate/isopropylmalate family dehydrogenase [Myxococcota bacterium]